MALASACSRADDAPPRDADSALASRTRAASSPISDKSLRPPPEGTDAAIKMRGMTQPDSSAPRADTALGLSVIDSGPASLASESDLTVLRHELAVPIGGVPTSMLRDTYSELRGGTRPHEALDILAPRGTPVLSATNGRVLRLFNSKPGGLMIYATDSSERFILIYGHLGAYAPGLTDGQPLRQGQQIGVVGTTGNAPPGTPHLHFAIARAADLKQWWKGTPVNPYPLLRR